MAEGVEGYPRWDGALKTGPTWPVIAEEEVRRGLDNQWARMALILAFAYTLLFLGSLWTLSQSQGDSVHNMGNFLNVLDLLPWATLGVAAIMAGPALLEDAKHGALELYLARAVTWKDYLIGKIGAVLGITTLSLWAPAVLYWIASFVFFDEHPDQWMLVPATGLVFALMWGLMVTGLGLGFSSVARSSRGATLVLFGGVAVAEAVISNLLNAVTRSDAMQLLSPFSVMEQQFTWIFSVDAPYSFPVWWATLVWAGLTILGWGLVWWKHPRLKGTEDKDAKPAGGDASA